MVGGGFMRRECKVFFYLCMYSVYSVLLMRCTAQYQNISWLQIGRIESQSPITCCINKGFSFLFSFPRGFSVFPFLSFFPFLCFVSVYCLLITQQSVELSSTHLDQSFCYPDHRMGDASFCNLHDCFDWLVMVVNLCYGWIVFYSALSLPLF